MKKFWICLLLVLLTGCSTPEAEPTCGPDGPPWILHNINSMNELEAFVDAAKAPETAEQWINENWNGSWDLLSGYEEFAALAAELETMPFPSIAAEPGVKLTIYPDYGRDYVVIKAESGNYSMVMDMEATVEWGNMDARSAKSEDFQALSDQSEGFFRSNRKYEGMVEGYRMTIYLRGYNRKDAKQFLQNLQFESLSETP